MSKLKYKLAETVRLPALVPNSCCILRPSILLSEASASSLRIVDCFDHDACSDPS